MFHSKLITFPEYFQLTILLDPRLTKMNVFITEERHNSKYYLLVPLK